MKASEARKKSEDHWGKNYELIFSMIEDTTSYGFSELNVHIPKHIANDVINKLQSEGYVVESEVSHGYNTTVLSILW